MTQSDQEKRRGLRDHWPLVMGGSDQGLATGPRRGPGKRIAGMIAAERADLFGWVPVLLALGAGAYFSSPVEPSVWFVGLACLAVGVVAWLSAGRLGWAFVTTLLLLTVVGFAAAKLRTEYMRAPILERPLGLVDIVGLVERIEAKPKRGARITLRPISIGNLKPNALPFRIRVRVTKMTAALTPGVVARLRARLAPPPPPALPGGFDFARHAWFQGIGAVGYGTSAPVVEAYKGSVPWMLRMASAIEVLRQDIATRMRAAVPGQSGEIAIALVTGERGGISEHTNQVYRDAGLYHVLSISGMHMAIMAGAVFFLVRLCLAAVPIIALRYPIKKWAAVLAALAALGYLALSGGAFATVRSYIMISVMFAAILIDRPALAVRNVAIAATVILLIYPESVLDPGFQMSFAAVLALVSVYQWLRRSHWSTLIAEFGVFRKGLLFLSGIVVSTLVAGLAVAPFAAYHFHTTQHLAVLANLIAMPVSNVVIMPAALGVLVLMPFGMEWPAVKTMGFGIDLMTATAEWVAALPGAVGHVASLPPTAFFLIVFGGLWLMLWQTRLRMAGLAVIASGLALAPFGPRPDILIGNKGKDVVVRGADGMLHPIKTKRRTSFEFKRWLEADGQDLRRLPEQARSKRGRKTRRQFQNTDRPSYQQGVGACDAVGCIAEIKGLTLAVGFHPGALRDDCRQADIVVFHAPAPDGCRKPKRVIDFFDIYYGGTHALYLDGVDRVRVKSVASSRGVRPWTMALPGRERQQAQRLAKRKRAAAELKSQHRPTGAENLTSNSATSSFDDDADDAPVNAVDQDPRAEP